MARLLASLGLGAILALAAAVPVMAAPLAREHYTDTFTIQVARCGTTWTGVATVEGLFMLKDGHGDDPTPYLSDNYRFEIVWTDNNDPSRSYIVSRNGLYKDVRITNVQGTTYQFEAMDVGHPFTIRTSEGRVVLQDSGALRMTFTVDTLGDADLGNDVFVAELGFETHGRFPGIGPSDEEFCALFVEAAEG
jgi:hypothetical protein